ncbi:MAG TPA: hypothetical protein VKE70_27755 [Candidatus Solibacter sp.]|nr:hypothetical protein [Candidatus Solibacter sp.]
MNWNHLLLVCATLAVSAPLAGRDPLPVPLKLPPGLVQTLPVDKTGTYMGDAVRIPDCPKKEDAPFGTCGNVLFGGLGLWNTHLEGLLQIRFFPPVNDIAHFEITHPFNLTGPDVVLRTPQFYAFGAVDNALLDQFNQYSNGDLNLKTGEVTNLRYGVNFFNIWYIALGIVNPKLKAPAFVFPGVYGSAEAVFEQRPDGLLDFTFYGSTFLPLGNNVEGDPVRLPLPFCGPLLQCGSIQVPGLSLHPHLSVTTKPPLSYPPCGAKCLPIPYNSVVEFTLNSRFSSIGDDFDLHIGQLGGAGIGRSQMQGRLLIQFGDQNGDFVPVAFNTLPPAGLLVPPPALPIAGLSLGLLGHDEILRFPLAEYWVQNVALLDDPFDIPVGELNVKTGQMVGGVLWRSFWTTSLLNAILLQNGGRIPPQSFFLKGPAYFETGPNGQWHFRMNSTEYRPFEGFTFPFPDVPTYTDASRSFTAPSGSLLTPFFNMQGVVPMDAPTAVMSGTQPTRNSSFNEQFSYTYSIPCNAVGKTGTFEYTNNATGKNGGTFKMDELASVTCFNSTTSRLSPGNYDTVTFTAFGTWSKDNDRHLATVQISVAPDAPYVSILIDGGTLSNVNTKPLPDIPIA